MNLKNMIQSQMECVSIIKNIFITYFFYIYYIYKQLIQEIFSNNVKKIPKINEEYEYIKKRTSEFKQIFDDLLIRNTNINPIFYNKKAYDEYMITENESKLEKEWKKRILLEYTPRGNVSMYYDPYKMGFKYSSDQKTISYELLNACAMKYVKLFRCRDFFMDEFHLNNKNSLIKVHYNIESSSKTKKSESLEGPFIKRNTTNQPSNQLMTNQSIKEPEKMKNKFLYVGKLSNTSFLNSTPKNINKLPMFRSALLDDLEQNSDVQNQRFSYKDFKKNTVEGHPEIVFSAIE